MPLIASENILIGLMHDRAKSIIIINYAGFVQVMEILESPGILFWHFPGLESPGKLIKVLESPGNLLTLVRKKVSLKRIVCSIIFGSLFCKVLLLQLLCIWETWKIYLSPGEVLEKSWKIVSEKEYRRTL